MKVDQLLDRVQARSVDDPSKQKLSDDDPEANETAGQFRADKLTPISAELINSGLMAVGGCRKCGRTFTDRLDLIHHFVDHFPSIFYSFETPNQVPDCGMLTQLIEILAADKAETTTKLGAHSDSQPIRLTTKRQLADIRHMPGSKTADSVETGPDTKTPSTTEWNAPGFCYQMCQHCCLTFSDIDAFEHHLKTHSSNSFSSSTFKCEQCEMRYNNLYLLEDHRRLHAKLCFICAKQFDTIFDLNLHVGEHLGNSYGCKDCGQCFSSRTLLAEHNRTHRMAINSPSNSGDLAGESTACNKIPAKNDRVDKPKSLLTSNLYFNGLVKNTSRRRRARNLHLNNENFQPKMKNLNSINLLLKENRILSGSLVSLPDQK